MIDSRSFLSRLPSLQGVDENALDALAQELRQQSYVTGQVLSLEGDTCNQVILVYRGIIRQRHLSTDGRQHVLSYATPGAFLNLVPAFDDQGVLATLDALVDVVAYQIGCQRFVQIVQEHPSLSLAISRLLSQQVRQFSVMARDLALHGVRTRLARFLVSNAEGNLSHQRWTQELIAAHIGTVRDVVGRVMRSFEEQGLIRRERGQLVILDEKGLLAEAKDE